MANAFSELTDPVEQRRRFEAQLDGRRKTGGVIPVDSDISDETPKKPVAADDNDEPFMVTSDSSPCRNEFDFRRSDHCDTISNRTSFYPGKGIEHPLLL